MADEQGRISDIHIYQEMHESYLAYAVSVLIDRALPDIRDGLKPVHRRILQTMHDLKLTPGRKFLKSAKIVGDCLGNYHPHGDSAVYDAMVRMAQDFSLRYPLVDGQGNFGSIDGDAAAAYRYTEARMAPPALDMLADIEYDTVDHRPSFDGRLQEPTVLPSRLPNLLVNGSSGIAVGMATNIPPHNLREVCAAIRCVIDRPECTVDELMQHLPAPDFPTGGLICGTAGVRLAYETGNGSVLVRARIARETIDGRECLVVSEIPYGIKLNTIYESIQQAHEAGKVTGLAGMHGGVVGNGIRLVLTLKKGEDPELVLNQLWQHTSLQHSISINLVALDGGRPRTVTLKRMITAWLEHRQEVICRRTRFLLARDEARLHIVDGLLRAIDAIDAVIATIRAAASSEAARARLIADFAFSERQAQAILDMPLRRLTGLERQQLLEERQQLVAAIADYQDILQRVERRHQIIKNELAAVEAAYGDQRRTQIGPPVDALADEQLIPDAPCLVTMTAKGYIKRMPVEAFRVQRRGGRGVIGSALKDDDAIAKAFTATTHQHVLVFTASGRCHWLRVWRIPAAERTSHGTHIAQVLDDLPSGETVAEVIPVSDFGGERYLLMATRRGQVKKTALAAYQRPRAGGIKAINLKDGDTLVDVQITSGNDEVLLATDDGQACRFHESEVRATGRDTAGVAGIDLAADASVVSLVIHRPGTEVLTVCRHGYGKRTAWDAYRLQSRAGKGVINIDAGERNGPVVASLAVAEDDQLLVITKQGLTIRMPVAGIRSTGRAAAGVRIVDLADDDEVQAVMVCPRDDRDDGEQEPASSAALGEAPVVPEVLPGMGEDQGG
ncbi:MAG: DNA gyrase subunit A [Planctomycetota bacterium]|nr:DNA gyrase subunit A [Planctomycetota bacterium]